jgi:hypothetical protein
VPIGVGRLSGRDQGHEDPTIGSSETMRAAHWLQKKYRKDIHFPDAAFARARSLMTAAVLASEYHATRMPKLVEPDDSELGASQES